MSISDLRSVEEVKNFIREDYQGTGKLAGKVVLVTGGGTGIGRAISFHAAIEGADVAITSHSSSGEQAASAKEWIEKIGRKCNVYQVDLGGKDACYKFAQDVLNDFGKVNILVSNAGAQWPKNNLVDIPDEQWTKTFNINLDPMFYLSKALLPQFQKDDSIINVTSVNAYIGVKELVDYSSTKGAMVSFTRALSNQIAHTGVRVNAIAPGPILTPIQHTWNDVDKSKLDDLGKDVPMLRYGLPSEVGPSFVFLASKDGSYITGQTIHVNGGMMVGG
ncbi:SDR family oxidoreductase [Acinetobacter apis]|uniref:NAD(P)-dependent dehydrogenase, short-chain alcohol dehydrogenase family n=1 Tax=Acinetobacter apis TaxID=1229165 RepID=A0A217ED12_9GAMM|nr:SDR family oxidoreductase [Acinetobacter apis]SNQ28304.1 NAD(P)-dependent dehydrogenase, short-chain alcohol dehydrogenase family [Acinetobacter apis]